MFLFVLWLKPTKDFMNWNLALQHNQQILLRNVAWLFTWLKLEVGESVETMPRLNRLTVLFVLRPSEAAYRRVLLVAVLVRGVVAPLMAIRTVRSGNTKPKRRDEGPVRTSVPSFKLTDSRKYFDLYPDRPKYAKGPGPRITVFGSDDQIFDRSDLYAYQNRRKPSREDDVSATSICRRMNALMAALEDMEGQTLRMAKLQARIARQPSQVGKFPLRVMRPGLPPGFRQRKKHEVDDVLVECHRLALMAQNELRPPDTS